MMKPMEDSKDEKLFVDQKSVTTNNQVLSYVRNLMSIFIGAAAGILGLTGIKGFMLYVILYLVTSLGLLVKQNMTPSNYFPKQTLHGFLFSGIGSQVVPFIMYWTLLYALVHLY